MRIIDSDPADREMLGVIVLNKNEAIQMIHDLVNLVSDAPGAGSSNYVLYRAKSMPTNMSRVTLSVSDGT